MLMADAVSRLSAKTPGKEAVAMEAYAKALRMVGIICVTSYVFFWDYTGRYVQYVVNKSMLSVVISFLN